MTVIQLTQTYATVVSDNFAEKLQQRILQNETIYPILARRYEADPAKEVERLANNYASFKFHLLKPRDLEPRHMIPLGRSLELAEELKPNYYVFLHGSNLQRALRSDILTKVCHLQAQTFSSRFHQFWRIPGKAQYWPCADAFVRSDEYKNALQAQRMIEAKPKGIQYHVPQDQLSDTPEIFGLDHFLSDSLLSVDANFFNNRRHDSAVSFFGGFSRGNPPTLDNDLADLKGLSGPAKVEFLTEIKQLDSWIKTLGNVGRMNVIAIPKALLEDPEQCFVYRSKPFGVAIEQTHEQFIEVLKKDQRGENPDWRTNQYRILIANLDAHPVLTFTFDNVDTLDLIQYLRRVRELVD